ncbi:type II secretion system protein GspM [Roseivivax sediminis]|uniref:Type II secretory pathway, component PulM n=1 Tax=Roseivivax sediminis TaxID=936889 RepID=A0A1I2AB74_9RHOB|nr:type II secretion system protein GspM [Roseivivax sediminis]SFE40997.1 Type II secretory pathway, component PulM [Roseivivax sediminis]
MIDALLRLAPRERFLLGVLVLLALPAAVAFGVLLPLVEERRAAEAALAEARAVNVWVTERAAEMAALAPAERAGPRDPVGLAGLERSLIGAGLRDVVAELSNASGGGVTLAFDDAPFTDLAAWLDTSDPYWGYDIEELLLERSDAPGLVRADLRLVPQGS